MTPETTYDAIIVGSGAGGAAAAYRLARAGLLVAVVEKGERLPQDGSTLDVQRVVGRGEFLSREAWLDGRGRPLRPEEHFNVGGKTKWYGAALLRFDAREFDADPAFDCRGWPLTHADLLPHYELVESLLGVREFAPEPGLARIARVVSTLDGWQAIPLPLGLSAGIADDRHEASHFDGFATVRDLKFDAENAILRLVAQEAGFELMTGAEVVAIEPAGHGPLAIGGVRLADGRRLRGRTVLLAAGALHSPRLLDHYLGTHGLAHLPMARHVGRYLKLHLLTAMVSISPRAQDDLIRKTLVFLNARFPHSSVQPLGFDGELIGTLMPRLLPPALARGIGRRAYGFFLQTEDGSHLGNRVLAQRASSAQPLPVLDYDATRTPHSAREHRQLARGFAAALLRCGFVSFTQRIGLNGTAHACGTLICGNDPATSVVDAEGRVHGLAGLYVVDGSVLPRSSRVNPSLTIFAWSLRVAERLALRLAGSPAEAA
jgi:choline dehydrogenase-like flavoprotein